MSVHPDRKIMPNPIEAVLIGAGQRGFFAYGPYALQHPHEIRFTAVAEPHDVRRARFARAHDISPERQFRTWEDLLAQGEIADAALICTPDRLPARTASAFHPPERPGTAGQRHHLSNLLGAAQRGVTHLFARQPALAWLAYRRASKVEVETAITEGRGAINCDSDAYVAEGRLYVPSIQGGLGELHL